jgi:hypothetical protein
MLLGLLGARLGLLLASWGTRVVQVALTLVLVAASGLFVATLRNLQTVDPGFATTGIVSAWLDTRATPLADGGVAPLVQDLLTRLRTIPGVRPGRSGRRAIRARLPRRRAMESPPSRQGCAFGAWGRSMTP